MDRKHCHPSTGGVFGLQKSSYSHLLHNTGNVLQSIERAQVELIIMSEISTTYGKLDVHWICERVKRYFFLHLWHRYNKAFSMQYLTDQKVANKKN